jgi:hypothetical protein
VTHAISGLSLVVAGERVWLAAAALVPVPVVRRVLSHRIATRRTITGPVAAYLQIAVVYTPATEVGHLVAASEAVLGQVFLVTFVALVVARFSARDPADD